MKHISLFSLPLLYCNHFSLKENVVKVKLKHIKAILFLGQQINHRYVMNCQTITGILRYQKIGFDASNMREASK